MEQRDAAVAAGLRARARHALRQRHNWEQLAKFCVVGASGYIVNLLVYTAAAAAWLTTAAAGEIAKPELTKQRAIALFVKDDKVADWLKRYPHEGRVIDATYESDSSKCSAGTQGGCWTVQEWWSSKDK